MGDKRIHKNLTISNPKLAEEWHPTRNGELTPQMVTPGSEKKVWWLGKCGHEWQASVSNRSSGSGCPFCSNRRVLTGFNDFATLHPELAKEWHPTKNGDLAPQMVTSGSGKNVWWLGKCGHEWQASIVRRSSGANCPFCTGQKRIVGINDLKTVNPKLAGEWHPTKNGKLKPEDVGPNSNRKVWWLCEIGHEWQASPCNRNHGKGGCPYCLNKKVLYGFNDLASKNPILTKEWHPAKNGELTPENVTYGSSKNVWWLGKCGHEWQSPISIRNSGAGCPYCSNHSVLSNFNDLCTKNPLLAEEWHPTKNGDLTPQMVLPGSERKVWWLGKCGHEWEATISSRNSGVGCPVCNHRNKTSFPEQAVFYYLQKVFPDATNRDCSILDNNMELDIYIPSIQVGIEYDGSYWHRNDTKDREQRKYLCCRRKGIRLIRIKENNDEKDNSNCDIEISACRAPTFTQIDRIIGHLLDVLDVHKDCDIDTERDEKSIKTQYLSILKSRSLVAVNPILAEEWHPMKNDQLGPEMFSASSGEKVWWLGKCGHEWQATIAARNAGSGCPYCSGQYRLVGHNDLASVNPKLAEEWHPTKNVKLKPEDVGSNSNKKVWWLGKCGHEWQAVVSDRNRGYGCPYCSSHRVLVGFNDLFTLDVKLAEEWHPTKNGALTPLMVMPNSNKKVWWLGKCGHEWQATPNQRSKKSSGCPYCANRKVLTGFNDLVTLNPDIAEEWHPTKNGDLTPQKVTPGSGKIVWWLGKCGHEWRMKVTHKSSGRGCPYCNRRKKRSAHHDGK